MSAKTAREALLWVQEVIADRTLTEPIMVQALVPHMVAKIVAHFDQDKTINDEIEL